MLEIQADFVEGFLYVYAVNGINGFIDPRSFFFFLSLSLYLPPSLFISPLLSRDLRIWLHSFD